MNTDLATPLPSDSEPATTQMPTSFDEAMDMIAPELEGMHDATISKEEMQRMIAEFREQNQGLMFNGRMPSRHGFARRQRAEAKRKKARKKK